MFPPGKYWKNADWQREYKFRLRHRGNESLTRPQMFRGCTGKAFETPVDKIPHNVRLRRWQIESLFKRLKQNYPLKYFLGDSPNAIKIQIWCALIAFKKETGKSLVKNGISSFSHIAYKDLNSLRGWLLNDKRIIENINRIESTGISLGEKFKIKNGIATLSNSTYIFKPVSETQNHYILLDDGKHYEIEKGICRDIIKPNILKFEHEIDDVKEKLIYPYTNGISPLSLMNEIYLKKNFPKAYKYLVANKEQLSKRDKGNGDYGAWYAFGRSQALNDKGFKLMFPYMAKTPHFVFTDNKDMLIYCGYAVFNESAEELKILKRILELKVFEYYMIHTSKPYSAGYFSYAKNYVKNFGICELNLEEKYFLSNGATQKEVNEFLIDKYKISI